MTFSLPGYQVGELIGYGTHSEVWSGVARSSGEPVALKRIPVTTQAQARAARTEAALLAILDHPSLIKFTEFVATADAVVLVQELAAGGCLADLIRQRGRLTPAEVGCALSPVAAALAHAHGQGVLHGDVSAANILFTAQGQPKLADLGVARLFDAGVAVGTPAYVDPVVASGGAPGAASDVFSLAAVVFHAVTGETLWPVSGKSAEQVWGLAAEGDLGDLTARLTRCPPAMIAAVVRALDPEPFRRGTAAELALDLRASVQPAEVVLNAGRVLTRSASSSGRPQFLRPVTGSGTASGADSGAGKGPGDPSDPAGGAEQTGGRFLAPDLTHVSKVRAQSGTATPAHRSRMAVLLASRKNQCFLLAVIVLLQFGDYLITGLTPWQRLGLGRPGGGPATVQVTNPAPTNPTATTAPLTTDQAAAVLVQLDGRRERAFSTRDADLLQQVYANPLLADQDGDQIRLLVPSGCGLTGLRTTYRNVGIASQSAQELLITAQVSLAPAALSCAGSTRLHTVGLGPAASRITLTHRGAGYLISSQQLSRV